jgi:hypothetical protein
MHCTRPRADVTLGENFPRVRSKRFALTGRDARANPATRITWWSIRSFLIETTAA